MIVDDNCIKGLVNAVAESARTENIGDGRIFISPVQAARHPQRRAEALKAALATSSPLHIQPITCPAPLAANPRVHPCPAAAARAPARARGPASSDDVYAKMNAMTHLDVLASESRNGVGVHGLAYDMLKTRAPHYRGQSTA